MNNCKYCNAEIPLDFGNPMCMECYKKNEAGEVLSYYEDVKAAQERADSLTQPVEVPTGYNVNGVWDPNYTENPEASDKEQWEANLKMFIKSSLMLYPSQRMMYTFIKNYMMRGIMEHPQYPKFVWKPKVVDVGSGTGVGANILSQEADFVWGIDKNLKSVQFAQECFTRDKNGIYYSSQVSFDRFDILEDEFETLKFDFVVCIEIIEHVYDYKKFLNKIIENFAKKNKDGSYNTPGGPTEFFISCPNRNHRSIRKDKPYNTYHVREWTSQEYVAVMQEFFENVELYKADGVAVPIETDHTPLLIKASMPKV